jgi:hypothetical protein
MKVLLTASFLLATLLGTADPPDLLTPSAAPVPQPRTAPTVPVSPPGAEATHWGLFVVPSLALVALAAAAVVLVLQRNRRS